MNVPKLNSKFEKGPAGSPLITLIHGVGGNLDTWDEIVDRLRGRFSILRYDLRGHGASEKPEGPYQLQDFVDDHVAILREHDVVQTHLVGFSLGGLIAQAIAVQMPDTVQKLILISTIAGRNATEKAAVLSRLKRLQEGGPQAHIDGATKRWFTDTFAEANPEVIEAKKVQYLSNDPVSYVASYQVLAENDLDDELPVIKSVSFVITGDEDEGSTARMAANIASRIPTCNLAILSGLRHGLLLEAPEKVADLIGNFLSAALPSENASRT